MCHCVYLYFCVTHMYARVHWSTSICVCVLCQFMYLLCSMWWANLIGITNKWIPTVTNCNFWGFSSYMHLYIYAFYIYISIVHSTQYRVNSLAIAFNFPIFWFSKCLCIQYVTNIPMYVYLLSIEFIQSLIDLIDVNQS